MPIVFKGFVVCDVCGRELFIHRYEQGRQVSNKLVRDGAEYVKWVFSTDPTKRTSAYCPECYKKGGA